MYIAFTAIFPSEYILEKKVAATTGFFQNIYHKSHELSFPWQSLTRKVAKKVADPEKRDSFLFHYKAQSKHRYLFSITVNAWLTLVGRLHCALKGLKVKLVAAVLGSLADGVKWWNMVGDTTLSVNFVAKHDKCFPNCALKTAFLKQAATTSTKLIFHSFYWNRKVIRAHFEGESCSKYGTDISTYLILINCREQKKSTQLVTLIAPIVGWHTFLLDFFFLQHILFTFQSVVVKLQEKVETENKCQELFSSSAVCTLWRKNCISWPFWKRSY